jgi:hypothetical protein
MCDGCIKLLNYVSTTRFVVNSVVRVRVMVTVRLSVRLVG